MSTSESKGSDPREAFYLQHVVRMAGGPGLDDCSTPH